MSLPACEHRSDPRKDGNFNWSHPKVFTAGFVVTPEFCAACKVYQIKLPPRDEAIPPPTSPLSRSSRRERLVRYLLSVALYWERGSPNTTDEEREQRWAICQKCSYQVDNYCTHPRCGCRLTGKWPLQSKINMATESCPIGKWKMILREGSIQRKKAAASIRKIAMRLQKSTG